MKVAVIGGGAAGFFSAIHVKENHPNASVTIFEKTKKVLSKVKVSGGGRCNVTNGTESINELHKAYPRGGKKLKKIFQEFGTVDTINWFESRNVPLYVQEDNRVFPKSDNSESIINCLFKEIRKLNISLETGYCISKIKNLDGRLKLYFKEENKIPEVFEKVIIATGGSPKEEGLKWLKNLGHEIEKPVPSLFTFNNPKTPIIKLMGLVAENTQVSIQGTKLKAKGPLLITHWGFSGPAVLKTSSFGARILSDKNYLFNIQINWINETNYEKVTGLMHQLVKTHPKKTLRNLKAFKLPERLWNFIVEKSELTLEKKLRELGNKGIHKLVENKGKRKIGY